MRICILLLLLVSAVRADDLPATECERWREAKDRPPAVEVNDFTQARAEQALAELEKLVADDSGNFGFPFQAYRVAEAFLRGYLLRKELLDARANREHDADEMLAFCEHWSLVAYEWGR